MVKFPYTFHETLVLFAIGMCLGSVLVGCGSSKRPDNRPLKQVDHVGPLTVTYHLTNDAEIEPSANERVLVMQTLASRLVKFEQLFPDWKTGHFHVLSFPRTPFGQYVPSGYPNGGGSTDGWSRIWLGASGHYLAHELLHCRLYLQTGLVDQTHSHPDWDILKKEGLY